MQPTPWRWLKKQCACSNASAAIWIYGICVGCALTCRSVLRSNAQIGQIVGGTVKYLTVPQLHASAGAGHMCASDAAGYLHCFGDDRRGKCNVPRSLGRVTQVAADCSMGNRIGQCSMAMNFGRIAQVAAGKGHACAIDAAGYLHCFGDNSSGQCNVPPSLGRITQAAAGALHICASGVAGAPSSAGGVRMTDARAAFRLATSETRGLSGT